MPALIAELLRRGYTERNLKKILGGNFLRVIREVTGR
jgi:microsomal dipeptidase-like Zn-dependent dipeptidase